MHYQQETIDAIRKIKDGTIAAQEAQLGAHNDEPLLVAMDAMLRHAKAYSAHFVTPIGEDGILGDAYGQAISGIRRLLDGSGGVAMERGMTGDSKDNGVIETLYWECCRVAGLDGDNL
jgi:hypothetical protein